MLESRGIGKTHVNKILERPLRERMVQAIEDEEQLMQGGGASEILEEALEAIEALEFASGLNVETAIGMTNMIRSIQ